MKFPSGKKGMRSLSGLHFPKVYEKLLKTLEVMFVVFLAMHVIDTGQTATIHHNQRETFLPHISGESTKYEKVAKGISRLNTGIFGGARLATLNHRFSGEVPSKKSSRRTQHRLTYTNATRHKWREISRKYIVRRKRDNMETTQQSKTAVKSWPHRCSLRKLNSKKIILECNPSYVVFYISKIPAPPHNASDGGEDNSLAEQARDLRELYSLYDAMEQFGTPIDVTDLRLWFQGIIFVESNAFKNLNRLKSLKLQNNKISYLSKQAFHGLTGLTEMDLSYNRLQSIPNNVFQPLSKLEILRLGNNELSYVQNAMFCGLQSLVNLDLSHNAIEDIAPHALRHFRSKYTVLIEVGYNNLRRPRIEWLQCFEEVVDPLCIDEVGVTYNVTSDVNLEIDNVTSHLASDEPSITANGVAGRGQHSRITDDKSQEGNLLCSGSVREIRAIHNPWSCSCNSSFHLLQFLELYNTIVTSKFSKKIGDDEVKVRYSENNATIILPKEHSTSNLTNKTQYLNYYKWHFTMPCATPTQLAGLDLGEASPSEKQRKRFQESCCNELTGSQEGLEFAQEDRIAQSVCSDKLPKKDLGLSDNEVTIIGIVIVFVTPILLTLCPDCDREIVPSRGGGVMSAGKFGAMSSNHNNNYNSNRVCPDSHEMVRTTKSGSLLNPQTCRKSRSQSCDQQYNEEIV